MKKRMISILLAMMLLLTCWIQSPVEASAAGNKVESMSSGHTVIECGNQFYAGDFVFANIKDYGMAYASVLKAAYASDNPEVLTVQEDGYAEAKMPGKAVVTVSCQGKSAEVSVTVVEKGTLSAGKEEKVEKWKKAGEKLAKAIPDTMTVENGYQLLKAMKNYLKAFSDITDEDEIYSNLYGYDCNETYNEDEDDEDEAYVLISPINKRYGYAVDLMEMYREKYHPMYQKKYWTGEREQYKVSVKPEKLTFTFKKKLDEKAILALYFGEALYDINSDEAELPLQIKTKVKKGCMESRVFGDGWEKGKMQYSYSGKAVFKKGSKTVTIRPTSFSIQKKGKWKKDTKNGMKFRTGVKYRMFNGTLFPGGAYEEFTIK